MNAHDRGVETAWWTLRLALGGAAFLAGLDKFFNLLASWEMYLAPWASGLLPVSDATFLRLVGGVEMAAGALVLSRWTRLGAYVVAAWLAAIALQLASTGMFYDLAVRDLVMACSALALAELSAARQVRRSGAVA